MPALSLFRFEDDETSPPPSTLNPWLAANERISSSFSARHVPSHEREHYARSTSWWQFVLDCQPNERWEPIGRPNRAQSTLQKERQALRRFIAASRPDDWPITSDWPGPSLAALDGRHASYLDGVYQQMVASGLSTDTVESTRSHLAVVFNHAVAVRAIGSAPKSTKLAREAQARVRIYTAIEIETVLSELDHEPDVACAFFIAVHLGPRPVDLFRWKWSAIETDLLGRRLIGWVSEKTKRHKKAMLVPLTARLVAAIDSLPRRSAYLFDGLSAHASAMSEKSAQARARNAIIKRAMSRAGIDVQDDADKPWQIARATANERLESVAPGVGQFVLGHSLKGVNARSYREPTEAIWDALERLPPIKWKPRVRLK